MLEFGNNNMNGFDDGFDSPRFDNDKSNETISNESHVVQSSIAASSPVASNSLSSTRQQQNVPINVTNRIENATVHGLAYLKGIRVNTGSTGKPYAMGQANVPSGSADFRIWGAPAHMDDGIYVIDAKWHNYKGSWQLNISNFTKVAGDIADYEYAPYDVQMLGEKTNRLIADNVSMNGRRLLNLLMHGNGSDVPDLEVEFKTSQAAVSHHDNVRSGLFAHSYKTLYFLVSILNSGMYPGIPCNDVTFRDIVLVGGLMHDIGKTLEYDGAGMSRVGKILSHRILGAERVILMRDNIIELIGEEGYERLLGIMMQHHGEFEETPRCIEAYIVHLADTLDTQLTTLSEARDGANDDEPVKVDGFQLI